jgi:hypothetical protein
LNGGTTARLNGVTIGASPITSNFSVVGDGASWGDFSLTSSGGFLYLNLFTTVPVPEPSTLCLLTAAAIGCAIISRKYGDRRSDRS